MNACVISLVSDHSVAHGDVTFYNCSNAVHKKYNRRRVRRTVESFYKNGTKRNRTITLYCHILHVHAYIHTYICTYIHTVCGTKKLASMGVNTDTGTDTGVIDNTFRCSYRRSKDMYGP